MEETAFNPKRRLCPDGSCVGVLGPDGRCSVCRRSAGETGDSSAEASREARAEARADRVEDGDAGDARSAVAGEGVTSGFDPNRRLCDDGSCVGVVGADGVCGTCGRRAE